jgi:hypothetical protein
MSLINYVILFTILFNVIFISISYKVELDRRNK